MARSRLGAARHKKKVALLDKAKGYRGGRSKLYRLAKNAVVKAEKSATRDRRHRKGEYRRLWIVRINAAVRSEGLTYSRFMDGVKKAAIALDRKSLSELAVNNPAAFAEVLSKAKAALG